MLTEQQPVNTIPKDNSTHAVWNTAGLKIALLGVVLAGAMSTWWILRALVEALNRWLLKAQAKESLDLKKEGFPCAS